MPPGRRMAGCCDVTSRGGRLPSVGHAIGMVTAKALGDVAVPADRPVGGENVDDLLGAEAAPIDQRTARGEKRRPVIVPAHGSERLAAEGAGPPLVPFAQEVLQQTGLRRRLDCLQATLAAAPPFRP